VKSRFTLFWLNNKGFHIPGSIRVSHDPSQLVIERTSLHEGSTAV
jgi:hypothetical protein